MYDSNPAASTYNGHMLRNSGKNCLFICCKQSSSTHFCHFLTTDLEIGGPCGFKSLCDGPKNERLPLLGALSIKWWAMRDVRVRLRRPLPLRRWRASRAALENASRFLSSAPCRVRIPLRWAQKRKAPIAGSLINQVVGDEGCRVRLRRPLPLRRFAPRVLRWKTLRVSSAPHPCGFESLCGGPRNERPPSLGAFSIKWWAMRDSNPQPCACKAPALTVAPIARRD